MRKNHGIIFFATGDQCWNCGSLTMHPTTDPDAPHGYKCRQCPALPSREKVERALEPYDRAAEEALELAASLDRLTAE